MDEHLVHYAPNLAHIAPALSSLLQGDREEILDAALRMLPLSADKLAGIRSGISGLREKLTERAAAQIQAILDAAEGLQGAGPLPRVEEATV